MLALPKLRSAGFAENTVQVVADRVGGNPRRLGDGASLVLLEHLVDFLVQKDIELAVDHGGIVRVAIELLADRNAERAVAVESRNVPIRIGVEGLEVLRA